MILNKIFFIDLHKMYSLEDYLVLFLLKRYILPASLTLLIPNYENPISSNFLIKTEPNFL